MKTWFLNILFLALLFIPTQIQAQDGQSAIPHYWVVYEGDTIPCVDLRQVHVFSTYKFKSEKEMQDYLKLVRHVRETYPVARKITLAIIESYEYMETLPDDKAKQKYLKEVQKYMMEEYKPKLKKMSVERSRILVKLIDRECNTSSYNIIKSLVGNVKATAYNVFAGALGNSLKSEYDPNGKDAAIENIVIQIEEGTLDYYYTRILLQSFK